MLCNHAFTDLLAHRQISQQSKLKNATVETPKDLAVSFQGVFTHARSSRERRPSNHTYRFHHGHL